MCRPEGRLGANFAQHGGRVQFWRDDPRCGDPTEIPACLATFSHIHLVQSLNEIQASSQSKVCCRAHEL